MSRSPVYVIVREHLLPELRELAVLPEDVRGPLLTKPLQTVLLAIRVLEGAEKRAAVVGLQEALAPTRNPKVAAITATAGRPTVIRYDGGAIVGCR